VAEVDLAQLRKNADVIAAEVGPEVGILAVVKADAYGHGAVACARALERKVWGFGVSLVEEGIELRRGGIEAPVVVLGSLYGLSHRDVVAFNLTPVLSDPADLPRIERAAEDIGRARVGVHLKIDTGMSRLGVRLEELSAVLERLRAAQRIELSGLCSHLADAESPDLAATLEQLDALERARAEVQVAGFRPGITHVANSAGLRLPRARFDLVRPGLALYGHRAAPAANDGLRPALALKSRIVATRNVPTGAGVSYGALFRAARPSRIATVPIGYADGYSRRLTGRAEVLVAGERRPIVGAITMDMCMVDITGIEASVGDEVVLIGSQGHATIDVAELAAWGGTIPYEILCGVSKRVPRVYRGERY
jgi:alanine racemase